MCASLLSLNHCSFGSCFTCVCFGMFVLCAVDFVCSVLGLPVFFSLCRFCIVLFIYYVTLWNSQFVSYVIFERGYRPRGLLAMMEFLPFWKVQSCAVFPGQVFVGNAHCVPWDVAASQASVCGANDSDANFGAQPSAYSRVCFLPFPW